jgi:hypothetical protein
MIFQFYDPEVRLNLYDEFCPAQALPMMFSAFNRDEFYMPEIFSFKILVSMHLFFFF